MGDDRDVEAKGAQLKGKRVDLIITGGISGIESPRLARELRRYGATVRVVMTDAATQFITPLSLEWASKNSVVTNLSGAAEHITFSDAVVIFPATLDFVSKISLGLADSAAATLVQSALSRIPVLIAPAMHESLFENPLFQKNLSTLKVLPNVKILEPRCEEGKAKSASIEEVTAFVCHELADSKLKNCSVVVTLGPTWAFLDDMRFISNRSTGALGLRIADELFRRGAKVHSICGPVQVQVPRFLDPSFVQTNSEMLKRLKQIVEEKNPVVTVFSAAVLDFEANKVLKGKKSSSDPWSVELIPSEKLLTQSFLSHSTKVGFKLESAMTPEALKQKVKTWASQNNCDLVVCNLLEDVQSEQNHRAFIFQTKTQLFAEAKSKLEIAQVLADSIESEL